MTFSPTLSAAFGASSFNLSIMVLLRHRLYGIGTDSSVSYGSSNHTNSKEQVNLKNYETMKLRAFV